MPNTNATNSQPATGLKTRTNVTVGHQPLSSRNHNQTLIKQGGVHKIERVSLWTRLWRVGPALCVLFTCASGTLLAWSSDNPITSWTSASDNLQHIAYISANQVIELYTRPGQQFWFSDNVTAISGAPPASATGGITSWMSASDNLQHIAYTSTNGHVIELYVRPGQPPWAYDDVTAISGAPPTYYGDDQLTSWMSASDNLQHIAYVGFNGHVIELYVRPGHQPWAYDDVTAISGAPPASVTGGITSWMSASDNLQYIAYTSYPYGHVIELYVRPGQPPWSYDDVTAISGAPPAWDGGNWIGITSGITSWMSASDNLQHIAYTSYPYGHVIELYMHPGHQPWAYDDVTAISGAPPAWDEPLTSWMSASDNVQHIAYDRDYDVIELYRYPGHQPWAYDNAASTSGAPGPFAGITSWMSASNNQQHVAYVQDEISVVHVIELYRYPGHWPWAYDVAY